MTGVTLGIETSGMAGLVALSRNGQLLEERELEHTRRRHAQTLILELQTLLSHHDVVPSDVDLIGISHGPGSFTGLRVGVVAAKTFAFAIDCRLVAVDTLAAIAEAADDRVTSISVVSDAQREQLFVGEFTRTSSTEQFERQGPIEIVDADAWCTDLKSRASETFAIAGPVLKKLTDKIPVEVRQLDEAAWQPRAFAIATLAERLAADEEFADPFELEPFYLRKSSAEEKRDARLASS